MILYLSYLFKIASVFSSPAANLEINITNLRSDKGHILISVYKSSEGFPDSPEKAFRNGELDISVGKAKFSLPGIPAGKYAVSILHDENDDKKMNKTWVGLPKEGYGFSNNVMGTFGPPSYARAAVDTKDGFTTTITIKTKY